MSGYVAMVLSFFAWGIAAAHNPGYFQSVVAFPDDFYIILGGLSGVFVIFPRLIMHKAITTLGNQNSMDVVKDKSSYSMIKIIALNLTSVSGFVQVYFVCNFLVMLVSLRSIYKGR